MSRDEKSPSSPSSPHLLKVAEAHSGERLDRFLSEALPHHSRSRWQRAIDEGLVQVDGKPAASSLKLKAGQQVSAGELESTPSHLLPEAGELRILYEDADLLVLDKPAGIAVHPGAGRWSGTLANALVHHFQGLPMGGGAERPGIVHRLDKDTSGLLIVARSESAHRALSQAMAQRKIERRYWGMVWGETSEEGLVEAPIGRSRRDRVRMAVVEGGRAAATEYRRVETYGFASELELKLRTGRTHQIRVHLEYLQHSVVGDPVYGGLEPRAGIANPALRHGLIAASRAVGRQALHAAKLKFQHPARSVMLEFESPLPEELEKLRTAFRSLAGL